MDTTLDSLLTPTPVAELTEISSLSSLQLGMQLFKVFLSLGIVCLLAFILIRFLLPKIFRIQSVSHAHFHILDLLRLEPKKTIYIIQLPDRVLVVGSTEQQLQTLTELDSWPVQKIEETQKMKHSGFQQILNRFRVGRERNENNRETK